PVPRGAGRELYHRAGSACERGDLGTMIREVTSFIDGRFLPPRGDAHRLAVINPATEEEVATLFEAGEAEVDEGVAAAKASFENGAWRDMGAEQRAGIFRRIAALTAEHADELCGLETIDLGIPTLQAKGMVTARVARNFNFYAD